MIADVKLTLTVRYDVAFLDPLHLRDPCMDFHLAEYIQMRLQNSVDLFRYRDILGGQRKLRFNLLYSQFN